MLRKKALTLCMATLLLLGTGTAFGQCSWSTKVVHTQTTSNQPALAAYTVSGTTKKIFLAYVGTDSNRTLNVMESTNGTSWGSQTVLTGWQSSSGVALGGAPPNFSGCGYLIIAIAQGANEPIYAQTINEYGTYSSIFEVGGSSSYSGYGITGAIAGTNSYLAWRGGSGNINLWSSSTGTKACSDTSNSAPAITSFNGALYVAWRSSSNNTINVASIPPF